MTSCLLLFDIDGTLVLTGGAGKRAMARAFADTFGVEDAFAGVPMAGRTDEFLLEAALGRTGIAARADARAAFRGRYLQLLAEEIDRPGTGRHGVMPGVERLLDVLDAMPGVHLALLTGNYRDGARIKLERFRLWDRFGWGAFGDDAADRNALVPVALARAAEREVPVADPAHVVVIGDTPYDVECARAGGARALGVATGGTPSASLRDAGADLVLEDLTALDAVLDFLGAPGTHR